jgi:hypothetical protein
MIVVSRAMIGCHKNLIASYAHLIATKGGLTQQVPNQWQPQPVEQY